MGTGPTGLVYGSMARRKPDDDDDGGLDSLLDTMTNVVGILVLVLIVTQMSVAEVVNRITTENKVDAETLAELAEELKAKEAEKDDLESVLIDPLSIDAEAQLVELERKKELLERRKKLLEEKEKQKNQFAMKIKEDREKAQANQKLINDTQAKRVELQSLISTSLERRAELKAKLSRTPKTEAPADIEVSIPNPRPPPKGAKQLVFICKGDTVFPVNVDLYRETAEADAKQIIARFKLDRDPAAGIDPTRFDEYWTRKKQKDAYFDIEYYTQGNRWPRIRIKPREGNGADADALATPRSQFRRGMAMIDVTEVYGRFFVYPDSFGIYVSARRLCQEMGLLAGWEAVPDQWEYTSSVPGGIELGPPRKPAPKPANTPARKPQNLID